MIDTEWLSDQLCAVLRWHMANPGRDDGPEVPWAGMRVWSLFIDLNRARGSGFGPKPITHQEIEAWSHIRREPVRTWEIDIIRALDTAFLEVAHQHSTEERHSDKPTVQSRPMSPALFDACFNSH